MECSLPINGNILGAFKPSRGIKQGYPLFLFIFILCFEVLSRMLKANTRIQGIKISRTCPQVTYFLYADDLLIACHANSPKAREMLKCLETYCSWFGLCVNKEKSSMLLSQKVNQEDKRAIKSILRYKDINSDAVYLGSHLLATRKRSKVFTKLKV